MTLVIRAPFAGYSSALAEVPDDVFARAMLGEGVAIDPTGNELRSPCDGEVISVAAARHAVAIRATGGAEILVHVGIDTVGLGGEGFALSVRKGDRVRSGDLLLTFDLDLIARRAKSLMTPVIVTNPERFRLRHASLDRRLASGDALFELDAIGSGDEVGDGGATTAETAPVAMVSESVVVAHAHGIHARPAGLIARMAKTLPYALEIRARGRSANPTSAVALMALGVRGGDEVVVVGFESRAAQGVSEIAAAIRNLESVPAEKPATVATQAARQVPVEPGELPGIIASRGFAVGRVVRHAQQAMSVVEAGTGVEAENAALERALVTARANLSQRAQSSAATARAILEAHRELLEDPQLRQSARAAIGQGKSAAFAWRSGIARGIAELRATGDARLAERAADLQDLERQVLRILAGDNDPAAQIPPGSILVAHDLTPSQLLEMDAARLAGMALAAGGPTSHVAILAATLGVPLLVSLGPGLDQAADGAEIILDAEAGLVNVLPDATQLAVARMRADQRRERQQTELSAAQEPCRLASGERIEVFANLAGNTADTQQAVAQGAEGCGLLRTEFLFLERTTAPDEGEQIGSYQQVADRLGGRPLVIRTLDVGGDKPIAYLPLPPEENPALGLRGIRTSLWRPELLDVQLRALLAVRPAVRILLPMITDTGEFLQVRDRLQTLCRDLGVAPPLLGAMIETPAAAMLADQIAAVADFLSIGTNDLAQYSLAMDRGHADLAARIDGLHPAVLRLIEAAARGAALHHRPVAVCGGLASDPQAVPLLLGLGVGELSVVPAQIPPLKALIRTLTLNQCRALAQGALGLSSAAEVRQRVDETLANTRR